MNAALEISAIALHTQTIGRQTSVAAKCSRGISGPPARGARRVGRLALVFDCWFDPEKDFAALPDFGWPARNKGICQLVEASSVQLNGSCFHFVVDLRIEHDYGSSALHLASTCFSGKSPKAGRCSFKK